MAWFRGRDADGNEYTGFVKKTGRSTSGPGLPLWAYLVPACMFMLGALVTQAVDHVFGLGLSHGLILVFSVVGGFVVFGSLALIAAVLNPPPNEFDDAHKDRAWRGFSLLAVPSRGFCFCWP